MGLFDKMREPVFLKETSNANEHLKQLKELEPHLDPVGRSMINQEIRYLEYGIAGEKNIAYELKNSHIPMYILQDIYLHDGKLSAQIDYLVFTKKICFVIECKNLYGDIEINNKGDFIRTTEFSGKKKKEGIYSPITQNQRHLELMKKLKIEAKDSILKKLIIDNYFEETHKSIVVLANNKTVLNMKFAKKETKDKVIRADQLIAHIKSVYQDSKVSADSDERMLAWARSYLDLHMRVEADYTKKYDRYRILSGCSTNIPKVPSSMNETERHLVDSVAIEDSEIFKELKLYRLLKSREENIKPYFIYNDNQLKDLISKMPKDLYSLQKVAGFGEAKVTKYGEDIIGIVKKYF